MTTPEEQATIECAERLKDCCGGTCGEAKVARAFLSLNGKLEAAKIQLGAGTWRVGKKVPLNVYEGDRSVCQCHNEMDAALIVTAMNSNNQEVAQCLRAELSETRRQLGKALKKALHAMESAYYELEPGAPQMGDQFIRQDDMNTRIDLVRKALAQISEPQPDRKTP